MWKTLRFRLAVWNALVVICTALVTLIGVRQGVRWALIHEMEHILGEDVQEITLALDAAGVQEFPGLIEELKRKAVGHRSHGWFVELRAGDRLAWSSRDSTSPNNQRSRRPWLSSDHEYRVVQRSVKPNPNGITEIRVGGTTTLIKEEMRHIDRLVLVAAGVVFVVAPLSGYWLASRAAQTVGSIIWTASRLRPSQLSDRLPIRGTGDELDQLAFTVNGLLDRIAEYLKQKRDFLADAAHELRTPLAAIRSSVEVALNGHRTREEYEDLLVDLIAECNALETLVNQLLLISESESELESLPLERVHLKEVVGNAVDMFQGVAESRDIQLTLRTYAAPVVEGCRRHLRQVANNLIDNAIKYTPPGGKVDVTLTSTEHGMAKLIVEDTGIGIAAEDVPRVFDRFFRADKSRTRLKDTLGSGLGLSICRSVVTAHGGHISCSSVRSQGTVFTVYLPTAATPAPAA